MRTVDPASWARARRGATSARRHGPARAERRVRAGLRAAAARAARRSSVRVLARLAGAGVHRPERYVRGAVWLAAACCAAAALCGPARAPRPARVARADVPQALARVPFPAVGICSNNVISRETLDNYTAYLTARAGGLVAARRVRMTLLQFAKLLTLESPGLVDPTLLQTLVAAEPDFNVEGLMNMLSPGCARALRRCSWRGQLAPCAHLLAERLTPFGLCCVFNSRYYDRELNQAPKYLELVGPDLGLTVVVKESPDDIAHPRRASLGADVILFDGGEYPLAEGGGVQLLPMRLNTSTHVVVHVTAQAPGAGAGACAARGERRARAWCLAGCRRRAMRALCGCRLHTLPPDPAHPTPVCSLIDLPCLNKHKEKFIYYYPPGPASGALQEEQQNGLECACAPDCRRLRYSARVSVARHLPAHRRTLLFRRPIIQDTSIVNSTVIRVYYSSTTHTLLTIEATTQWYEKFAALSAVWWTVTGVSLVAAGELLHCGTLGWWRAVRERDRR